jgi:hypothetical protein
MADRVLIPLPDGRWLALSAAAFQEALKAGEGAVAPETLPAPNGGSEPLLNAGEMALALKLPKSCVYERART